MKSIRWELLVAAALLTAGMVVSAFLIAPQRYTAFVVSDLTFVRLDQRTGEALICTWARQCNRVLTQPPDAIDNLMANAANEAENSN